MDTHFPILEAVLHVQPLRGHIDISMINQMDAKGSSPRPTTHPHPDVYSPNACATLRSPAFRAPRISCE